MEKRLLQILVFIFAFIPIMAGVSGIISGSMMTGFEVSDISLDSHVRYLSGILLAIGFGYWSTIKNIESKAQRFQLLTFLVFVGGLARLWGVLMFGWPDTPMVFGLMMELIVTPVLCVWQFRIAKSLQH